MNTLVAMLSGFVFALLFVVLIIFIRKRRSSDSAAHQTTVYSSMQKLKDVGELVVFKVFTKEIVTEVDHTWGEIGQKYLSWVLSGKKMAMIFEFEIDFWYNLRSEAFQIEEKDGSYCLKMPPCQHRTNIRNIQFYDEQKSKLIPWLVPDLLNSLFGDGFDEKAKNKLINSARLRAEAQANEVIQNISSDIEKSAKQTLQPIANAFGSENVQFEFSHMEEKESAPASKSA